MASISTDKSGNRRILFVDPDGRRRPIRLGKMPMKATDAIKTRVEHLLAAKIAGCGLDSETARWVIGLSDELAAKLAAVDLIPPRERASLGEFTDADIVSRNADAKAGTITNLKQARRNLVEFLGATKRMDEVTQGDADDYRRHLTAKVGENTARRHLGRAKQFFRAVQRKKLIVENPFADMKGLSVGSNKSREFFIGLDAAAAVLKSCPDVEWRLIFGLSRFGGLRTPSEHYGLRWVDVDWEQNRFLVHSPKTEHHDGGESRWVPIFPELLPLLVEAFEAAPDGAEYVVNQYRNQVNLRTRFEKIVRRAGLTPWPKLFHNLRASRQTELAEGFPMHVVCAWLGNSPKVAQRHYLQVTEDHFTKAAHFQCSLERYQREQ